MTLFLHWPGELTPDSRAQLAEARLGKYGDWHPPVMASLWSALGAHTASMLALQVLTHWIGLWALAEALRREVPGLKHWLILAVGMSPIALKYIGILQKDSLLASSFICAFGMLALTSRPLAAIPIGLVGTLARANGVFALPPLLLAFRTRSLPMLIVSSLAAAIVLVPVTTLANRWLFQPEQTGVLRSVQLFDLTGISYFSGDGGVLPRGAEGAVECYTPLFWDTLPRAECAGTLDRLPHSLTSEWIGAILAHPMAYVQHRLNHFNRTTFFIVPAMQQCVEAPAFHQCDFSTRGRLVDLVSKNALLWPVTWLVAGMLLLWNRPAPLEKALVMSGLLFGFAYVVVGVATDFRYFYWTELAVQAAFATHFARQGHIRNWRLITVVLTAIFAIGYAARYAT